MFNTFLFLSWDNALDEKCITLFKTNQHNLFPDFLKSDYAKIGVQ